MSQEFSREPKSIQLPLCLAPSRKWIPADLMAILAMIAVGYFVSPFQFNLVWVLIIISVPFSILLLSIYTANIRTEIDEKGVSLFVWRRRFVYLWNDIRVFEVRRTLTQTVLEAFPEDHIGNSRPVQIRHFNGLRPHELGHFLNMELAQRKMSSKDD